MDNKLRVFIIDDELGPREAMRMILKDIYDVRTASGAREGIDYISKQPVDLVILDIKMPEMDGISVLKEIKKINRDIEVVMVTAYASLETARSAIRYGALDYLIKPFDKNDVLNVVEHGLVKKLRNQKAKADLESLLTTNKTLEKQVFEARNNFVSCYEGTIKALLFAIDAKDHYTFNHSNNVATLSVRIADALGFSQLMKNRIEQAAMIHDIGKIGIEESILRKEGSLTIPEFNEIKKHPQIGARIVNAVPFIEETSQVILYHHERFDGKGYPEGLKGESIPLPVRIVTIADAIDSMFRDRPYRKSLPNDLIIRELKECSGTQFDPEIVRIISIGTVPIFDCYQTNAFQSRIG